MMRKLEYAIFIAVLMFVYSCNSNHGEFNESVPDFYTLTTTVTPEEGGTILPSGGEYLAGEGRQIVARPAEGYVFDEWAGDLTGDSNPNHIQFNTNKTVTAQFSLRGYSLNLEVIGNGAVSETVVKRTSSVTVRLDAVAEEDWYFERWEGDVTGSSNPETIIIGDEEKSVKAVFKEIPLEEYTVTTGTMGSGTVERDPDKELYTEGERVSLIANAALGWTFREWTGDLSGSTNPQSIVVDADKQITAVFERIVRIEYTISINTEGSGSVKRAPDRQSYTEGQEINLIADAASGWKFKEWRGDLSGSTTPQSIVVDSDKQITAVFEKDPNFGITVQDVKFYIKEMELGGARRTGDFKTKDFILNVPVDGSPFEITHVSIPRGFYDELELDIDKPKSKDRVDDSDFRDGSDSYSIVVKGIYNGTDFTYRSSEDFEIDVDISPNLEITSGQTSIIAIAIDFDGWFKDGSGGILDPRDSGNTKKIDKNIEDSFSDFEDDF